MTKFNTASVYLLMSYKSTKIVDNISKCGTWPFNGILKFLPPKHCKIFLSYFLFRLVPY